MRTAFEFAVILLFAFLWVVGAVTVCREIITRLSRTPNQ